MRARLPSAAGLLVLALVALAGCGSSSSGDGVASQSPVAIVRAAKAAADGASTVHVSGSTTAAGTPVTLDLSLVSGRGGLGRLTEDGLSFELVALDGTLYISGSSAFYSHFAGAAAAQLLRGKWLKVPASSASFAGLSTLIEPRKLLDNALAGALAHPQTLAKVGTSTIHGQAVVGIRDTTHTGTLYVATSGPAYPLELTKGGAGGGTITFSAWDRPVTLTAPADAVDVEQLRKAH